MSRDDHCLIHHADVFIPPIPADPLITAATCSSSSPVVTTNPVTGKRSHTPDVISSSSGEKKKKSKKRKSTDNETPVRSEKQIRKIREKDADYKNPNHRPLRHFTPSQVLAGIPISGINPVRREPEPGRDFTVITEPERRCLVCSQTFKTRPEMDFHHPCYDSTKFRVLNGYKCFRCKDSSFIYPDLKQLRIHAVDHSEPKFECMYCSTKKFMEFEMKHHISYFHKNMLKITDADKEAAASASGSVTAADTQQNAANVPISGTAAPETAAAVRLNNSNNNDGVPVSSSPASASVPSY
jgi:hypothetical protein